MNKSCGGCKNWIKIKNDNHTPAGMCNLKEGRVSSDFVCTEWKAISYNRNNKHKTSEIEKDV
jgi:hypothetical protein